ncbi:MAG: ROK family protein, partial [Anaerolineae bacterium]
MNKMLYASIDLGGTKIACAFGTADGEIVAERAVPTLSQEGPQAVLARIADLVNALAAEIGQQPVALGMGVPGLADVSHGVVKFLPNLPTNWRDVPV